MFQSESQFRAYSPYLLLLRGQLLRFMKLYEPAAVKARRARRFVRRIYYGAGVMETISIDQHDKWKRFGLFLHCAVDPFSGKLHWNKIWWTNHNPRLIGSYYFEAVRKNNNGTIHSFLLLRIKSNLIIGIPLKTQGDPGGENNVVANVHSEIRQKLDPSLQGSGL